MPTTRRALFSIALLPLLHGPLRAATCDPLLPELSLCDARGWRVDSVTADTVTLLSEVGIVGTVVLHSGLSPEAVQAEEQLLRHMPISARADVLELDMPTVSGHYAGTVAYRPRHEDPALVVALTIASGVDFVLSVHSRNADRTYTSAHKAAHAALLNALRLDLPE